MSSYEASDRNVVAEELAEYGLVLLADGEPPSPALSAVRRGIAADAGGRRSVDQPDDEGGSFVFVVPWYSRRDHHRTTAGGRSAAASAWS
ncbi:MAG TPA: hypothetical protein VHJ40_03180 [Actinomycetota bacterium]|nr:hypothetical protein [Actinomycetota bacterium]